MPVQSVRLKGFIIFFCLFLVIIPGYVQTAKSQAIRDDFEIELITACVQDSQSLVNSMVSQHRLWVKPVVDRLISDFISQKLKGDETASNQSREAAINISQSFLDNYGEKSLQIGVDYLDVWSIEQLNMKYLADSLFALGTGLRGDNQQHKKAIEHYQQALKIYTNIGDKRGEANVIGGLGFIYWFIDHMICLSYYQKALEVRQKIDDKQLIGASLNGIGLVYHFYISDYERAIEYYDKAVVVWNEIEDWAGLGETLTYLASVYGEIGQPERAIQYFKQSYEINKKIGNYYRMAEARLNSGINLHQIGKYPEALEDLESAIKIYRSIEDTIGIGDVLTQMGFVYASIGDHNGGIEKCKEALQLMQQADDLWGMAGVYNNMGIILQHAGRPERAVQYYENSLKSYEKLEDRSSELNVLNNLGTVYFDLKNYDLAEEYHTRSLQLSRELQSRIVEVQSLINLANDQNRLGKLDESLSNYESALPIARSLNNPEALWKTLVGIAEIYKLKGDYTRAIEYNEEGFKIIEKLRVGMQLEEFKTSYMARERYAYEDVINMLAELHEENKNKGFDLIAFQYAQRSKSRAFMDLMAESRAMADDSIDLLHPQPVSLKEIQSSCLENNTVFLEYSLGDSNSYLWVITSDDHSMVQLPDRKTLQEQIETMRFALLNPEQDNYRFLTQSGYTLYTQLIEPAEQFLSENANLVILPDGILNYLPFEVLITQEQEKNNKASYSGLPYLVKKYPISYGQSSSILRSLVNMQNKKEITQRASKSLIAFGDPVYENMGYDPDISTRESFSRLEHSGKEVEKIAGLFQDGFADIYLRIDATEENVKSAGLLDRFNYVHFATHGLINEENPDLSSLVLSLKGNSTEDGFLQATEIFNLDLDADLVVLSACQTGLGKMVRGEGMIGLTRAFMYAGTPSVLVSLWSVSDRSTAVLMERFYEHLLEKNLSRTEALRRTQLLMLQDEQFAHPFFWAPFVLIGKWN